MPESLLTILKFCLLAVLYLFFARVLRAVWASINAPREAPVAAPAVAAPAVPRPGAPAPAPAPAVQRLRVVEPPDASGPVFEVADEVTVGRGPGNSVALDDTYASARHARVFRRDGQVYVEDLGSTNGTFLNRQKVSRPVALRRGDRLQVGRTVLEASP